MATDQTIRLLREGYRWAPALRGADTSVRTRLMGRSAVLVGGPEGVRRFYDPSLRRHGAFPAAIRLVLFGPRTLHGLDDAAHHARKALFVDLLTPAAVQDLAARAEGRWQAAIAEWPGRSSVALFDEAVRCSRRRPWTGPACRRSGPTCPGGRGSWSRWWTASPPRSGPACEPSRAAAGSAGGPSAWSATPGPAGSRRRPDPSCTPSALGW